MFKKLTIKTPERRQWPTVTERNKGYKRSVRIRMQPEGLGLLSTHQRKKKKIFFEVISLIVS